MSDPGRFTLVDSRDDRCVDARTIAAIADALHTRLDKGQIVTLALSVRDKFDLITILLAAGQLAVRIVPLDPAAPPEVRLTFLNASGASIFITDFVDIDPPTGVRVIAVKDIASSEATGGRKATFSAIAASWLFFTSGSTGTPKGVELTPDMLRTNVTLALRRLPYENSFCTASLLPAFHTFTLISDIMTAFALESRCIVLPNFEVAALDHIVDALIRHRVNAFSGVPIVFEVLARMGQRLVDSELRFAVSGAAPLTAKLGRLYATNAGHPLIPCYGMTEGVCFLSISDHRDIEYGSAGVPVVDLRIVDERDRPVDRGVVGEIQVRGETVIEDGYFCAPLPYEAVYAEGGWLRTGDLGYLDARGLLFITGRLKNMIIRGGKKVYLEDVEALFETGTVAGVPSGEGDREEFAFFFEQNRYHADYVRRRIRDGLGAEHLPDRTIGIRQIPKSPTGKLQRQILAEGLRHGNY
jgi:acyl-CoA synthetase (AMP-forming)/AMP-acid ligase II